MKLKEPSYRRHRSRKNGPLRGMTEWERKRFYFPGLYRSHESLAAFRRFRAAVMIDQPLPSTRPGVTLLMGQLVERYLVHADARFRAADGTEKQELGHIRRALGVVLAECPAILIDKFGPRRLASVQNRMLSVTRMGGKGESRGEVPANWTRQYISAQIDRVVRMFKWAVAEELVPVAVYQALGLTERLRKGETTAPEGKAVEPVAESSREAVANSTSPTLAAMIRLQKQAVMRSTELCLIRPMDIDTTVQPWEYTPEKNAGQKGSTEKILFGPKAQVLLAPFMSRAADQYIFSPRDHREWVHRKLWGGKPTKKRKQPKTGRKVGERYNDKSYRRAVVEATKKLNLEHWHPHQIRHSGGTDVRAVHGLEGAQVALRHKHAKTSERYAEVNRDLARRIALEMG